MTIEVDNVATDSDLEDYTLGESGLLDLLPDDETWFADGEKSAKRARQTALDNILKALKNRRPPILATDLQDPTELKQGVCYGALEILYRGAVQHDESPNAKKATDFGNKFRAEVSALQPSLFVGVSASALTFRVSRG